VIPRWLTDSAQQNWDGWLYIAVGSEIFLLPSEAGK